MEPPIIHPIPVCEAKTGVLADERGFAAAYCYGTRGLRVVLDSNGHRHFYCPARGHGENVRVRVRRMFGMTSGELTQAYGR